jgi:hypothetical protein
VPLRVIGHVDQQTGYRRRDIFSSDGSRLVKQVGIFAEFDNSGSRHL